MSSYVIRKKDSVLTTLGPSSIVSFNDNLEEAPINSLIANVEPVQDLHGYNNPWPAGGGKNLANLSLVTDGTVSGESVSVSGSSSDSYKAAHIVCELKGGTAYTFSAKATRVDTAARIAFRQLTAGATIATSQLITSAGDLSVTYTPSEDMTIRLALFSTFGSSAPTSVTVYENIQLEVGSTATPYEPCSNICPITGWTGANVYQAGKNLADLSLVTEGTVSGETVSVSGSNAWMAAHIVCNLKGGITYTFSAKATRVDTLARIAFRQLTAGTTIRTSQIITGAGNLSVTYTPSEDITARLAMFSTFGSSLPSSVTVYENIQLEVGPSVTAYEPHQGGAYTIPFPTPPGTVYGGTLTIGPDGRGTLAVDRGIIASYAGESLPGAWISDRDGYAAGRTPTTGAQVVYELATPVTYTITAEQITPLAGTNNLWVDSGDITIKYSKKLSTPIPGNLRNIVHLTNEQFDSLQENGSITSNNQTLTYNNYDLYITPNKEIDTTYSLTQDTEDGHKLIFKDSNDRITNITIPDNDTTYQSKSASNGGIDVSLVTTGEKYIWNSKTSNTGTVTSITPGNGLISGTSGSAQTAITTSGTISIGEGKVTNAMLAGSIANGKLANSSIKIGSKTINLGDTVSLSDIGVSYPVTGVKGNAESTYRTGNVNLTAANIGAVATSGNETVSGTKTLKFTSRVYPLVKSQERSTTGWYKITFPYSTATTTTSARWFMNSFDLHFGGGYNANPSGLGHIAFYWTRAAENGVWSANQVSAKIEGILVYKIKLYYRITEPGVLYVYNQSRTYNGILLDNLYVDDSSVGLDWSTTTIEACDAITINDYILVPTVYTYSGNNEAKYYIGNDTTISGALSAISFSGSGASLTSLNPANLSGAVPINLGGTNATTVEGARTNLGLGTIAVKAETDYIKYNGIDTSQGASTPAASVKTYWANNEKIPKNSIVFAYNSSGVEYTTLYSNNNNKYGTILKWGYLDRYIRILRAHPTSGTYNGWYTEDWEKISAGYADSAGSVALSGVTNADDLKAIEALTGTSGLLKKTATNTWSLDTTSYAPLASPALTGTPTAPTAANGTNTAQIATTAFVNNAFAANDAMIFKGTIGSSGATVTALPATHNAGWTYRVITASTYAGIKCEIGDLIICVTDGTADNNAHWTVAQTNIDGAVIGSASSTENNLVLFGGTNGKSIKDSGVTLDTSSGSTTKWLTEKGTWTTPTAANVGAASSIHNHYQLTTIGDNRNEGTTPNTYSSRLIFQGLKYNTRIGAPYTDTYSYIIGLRGWGDSSGGDSHELAFNTNGIYRRQGATTEWGNWFHLLDSNNYTNYAIAKTAGVTAVTWDSTNKKLTRTINDTTADVVTFAAGSNISLTAESGKLTIANTYSAPVSSVAGKTGTVTLAKGDVGLGNVDNTADANKTVKYANMLTGFSTRSTTMAWGNQTGSVITYLSSSGGGGWGFRDNNPVSGQMSMTIDGTIYIKEGAVNIGDAVKSFSVSGKTVTYTTLWGNTGTFTTQDTDTDTKNTAGSANSTSKLYLIGATSQAENPTTNSYQYTYTNNGLLSALKLGLNLNGTEKAHLEWNNTDQSIDFVFA